MVVMAWVRMPLLICNFQSRCRCNCVCLLHPWKCENHGSWLHSLVSRHDCWWRCPMTANAGTLAPDWDVQWGAVSAQCSILEIYIYINSVYICSTFRVPLCVRTAFVLYRQLSAISALSVYSSPENVLHFFFNAPLLGKFISCIVWYHCFNACS